MDNTIPFKTVYDSKNYQENTLKCQAAIFK